MLQRRHRRHRISLLILPAVDASCDLGRDPSDDVGSLGRRFVTPALLAAAFVVSVTVPAIGMWAMLLFVAGPVSARV